MDKNVIFLVAPNVSEQMGGEAIKALQIYDELTANGADTVFQITHERCEKELEGGQKKRDVYYIRDTKVSIFLWKSVILRGFVNYWFLKSAIKLADKMAQTEKLKNVAIWQTEPNSPALPRPTSKLHVNIAGPINGNIYYPPFYKKDETLKAKLRRVFHNPFQHLHRIFFYTHNKFDLIFVAGGERTRSSLISAGYNPEKFFECIDCGIPSRLLERERVEHKRENNRFIHFGRLVFHKQTELIIKAVAHSKHTLHLDIVGRGPELEHYKILAKKLGVDDRVHFFDWYENHSDLLKSFHQYRGFILPSIEDANGIVVQEVMACGVPPICLNWGGPQLLIKDKETGFLIDPVSKQYIVEHIASSMEFLSQNPVEAERISISAKNQAQKWEWRSVIREWSDKVNSLHSK